jgi:hypothetical protein
VNGVKNFSKVADCVKTNEAAKRLRGCQNGCIE